MLGLSAAFVYLRVSRDLDSALNDSLRARADDLIPLVDSVGPNRSRVAGGPIAAINAREGFSQILRPTGTVLATTLHPRAGAALDREEVARATRERIVVDRRVPGVEGDARVLAAPAERAGHPIIVVVGASTDDRREALAGLTRAFLIGAPLAIVLASGLGYLLARRSLAPVDAMRLRAGRITLERSDERLPLPRAEDELHALGETLNTMLDRLEAGLERERVFVADASHELRTPLAILKGELELADSPDCSPEDLRLAVRSAGEEIDRLSQLAEDLLVIARLDRGQLAIAREPIMLETLLERVRDRFAGRTENTGRAIAVDAPTGPPVDVDPLRVEQALGNLVENALRHGAGDVRLSAHRDDGFVVLEVSDGGPGFPAGFEAEAFERFTRGAAGRSGGGGAGLGLAIVKAIAVAHGGGVSVAGGPPHSATIVRLTLRGGATEES